MILFNSSLIQSFKFIGVQGMKPIYLKLKEINLRFDQIDQRITECERPLKNVSTCMYHNFFLTIINNSQNLVQNKSVYYEELERGFSILERYEMKFTKAAEYDAKNDLIMCVRTLK